MYIEYIEYVLRLSTREAFHVAEINYSHIQDQSIRKVLDSNVSPINLLARIPPDVMEEAKLGYDVRIKNMLSPSPYNILMKIKNIGCRERKYCASFNSKRCDLGKTDKTEYKLFSRCFIYPDEDSLTREIISSIIMKMVDGFHVILVSDHTPLKALSVT